MAGISNGDNPDSVPLLTICIPSYNRGERVRTLVDYLLPVAREYGGAVEIIVSNNASKDNTADVLGEVKDPHFLLHNRTLHLPTAEEHIFHSARLCRGAFVWFLGDDDIPNLETVRQLLSVLRSDGYDFLFYNSHYMDAYAGYLDSWFLSMNREVFEAPFGIIAPSLGFISLLAGLSNVVCRRALLDDESWQEIVKLSHIYSHVAWWYLCFHDKRMAIMNRPLVTYRQDNSSNVGVHFRKVAKDHQVGDYHFWTVGLIRLFTFMEERGAITPEQIRSIWEQRRDGTSFRLIDNILAQFFAQVALGSRSGEERNKLPAPTFEMCRRWFLRIDPSIFETMRVIDLAYAAMRMPDEDAESRVTWTTMDFEALFGHRVNAQKYLGVIARHRGYELFAHPSGVVAIEASSPIDRQRLLRSIDPETNGADVFAASDEASVRAQIDKSLAHKLAKSQRINHDD